MNMQLSRTIKIKLDISIEAIKPTIEAYTKAFNFVCRTGWNDSDSNGVSLHHKTYKELKVSPIFIRWSSLNLASVVVTTDMKGSGT